MLNGVPMVVSYPTFTWPTLRVLITLQPRIRPMIDPVSVQDSMSTILVASELVRGIVDGHFCRNFGSPFPGLGLLILDA